MAVPSINDLKMWVGTLFTKDEWDYNFSQIVSWFSGGKADLVVNSVKATNGIDLDGSQLTNLGAATTGSQAVTLDQATTLLNRSSYYYPFSVASGKVNSSGNAAFIQKDSDTQVTVLAGNVNPDLVCILSDATIESVTSNTVLTVPATNGTYHIIKEKEQAISITSGSSGKVTVGKKFPSTQNIGDYFCDNSTVPFKGYKYTTNGWEETPFCWLGDVVVSSGTATVKTFGYNNNNYDVNVNSLGLIIPDYTAGVAKTVSTVYTTKKDVVVRVQTQDNTSATGRMTINGTALIFNSWDYQYNYDQFYMAKGTVWKFTVSGSINTSVIEYPLKGAN